MSLWLQWQSREEGDNKIETGLTELRKQGMIP